MVSDQAIAESLESLLREANPRMGFRISRFRLSMSLIHRVNEEGCGSLVSQRSSCLRFKLCTPIIPAGVKDFLQQELWLVLLDWHLSPILQGEWYPLNAVVVNLNSLLQQMSACLFVDIIVSCKDDVEG
ncbi:hypothetical protein RHMOL_Rhmol13G0131200 [Rhododendron molle]|uniref:Uncharacterized protein n=1 Tax=Rhododendron molle TaxID=49168 RepID=A0ACC0L6R1_RHOML|nr:hypothetical protein RHMOL_Rhmol13G0131200 [Rhododendron molle]